MIKTYPEIDITIHNERTTYIDREWVCTLTKYDAANLFRHNTTYLNNLWGNNQLDYKSVMELFSAIEVELLSTEDHKTAYYYLCAGLLRALKAIDEGKKVMLEVGV